MRFSKETLLVALAAGTFGVAGTAGAATTLDFTTGLNNSGGMPDTYGDNLAGTPNIDLTWNTAGDDTTLDGWDSYDNGWDGRGPVGQTDFNQINPMTVSFTADAGFGTFVTSFDLDEFAGGGDSVVNWELVGTGFSGTWDDFSDAMGGNGGRSTVNTGMTAGDAVAGTLVLQLEMVSGTGSYLAMDNLAFDQVVIPEPGSAILALGGLGALTMRRKRK